MDELLEATRLQNTVCQRELARNLVRRGPEFLQKWPIRGTHDRKTAHAETTSAPSPNRRPRFANASPTPVDYRLSCLRSGSSCLSVAQGISAWLNQALVSGKHQECTGSFPVQSRGNHAKQRTDTCPWQVETFDRSKYDAHPRLNQPLNPTTYTLHPTPYTLNPKSQTLSPKPQTPNPKPYTLHPKP